MESATGELIGPKRDIAKQLYTALRGKEQAIAPPFHAKGTGAAFDTNEYVVPGFFEAIQAKKPDGYVLGVGTANIFSMLYGFEASEPQAVVMVDVDPKVVIVGKFLVQSLLQSKSADEFVVKTFTVPEDEFIQQMQALVAIEENDVLRQQLANVDRGEWQQVHGVIDEDYKRIVGNRRGENESNTYQAIMDNYQKLKILADNGNIAAVYADFTNPVLIDVIKNLPDFEKSTNIIYCSNIVDQITNLGLKPEDRQKMDSLRSYEPAIFVDSLQAERYYLRAHDALPQYTDSDVIDYEKPTPPPGAIFGK